ncbi:MAG TPA: sigma-70 family RNA polymerase sigma factor [Planctomycetota bacterium]|jgi:RNA polymerase sigma-70 factor (ECF subfamily)|nr:sigma-70 family RNA polymerase sigma factor [Planctomycetota bacterium]
MADVTCWTLIECAADGDRAARDAFVERYLPVVRAYMRARWGNRVPESELEDTVQEVFVECLREEGVLVRNRSRRGAGFRAYLFGAVRNVALRAEEARAKKIDEPRTASFEADGMAADGETSSRAFDRAWAAAIVREAAEKQKEKARTEGEAALRRVELLRLVFQEERGIAEIARDWDVPPESLHREYAKARAEFTAALKDVVAFHVTESDAAVDRECRDLMSLLG